MFRCKRPSSSSPRIDDLAASPTDSPLELATTDLAVIAGGLRRGSDWTWTEPQGPNDIYRKDD
jgi:hypothetical protein